MAIINRNTMFLSITLLIGSSQLYSAESDHEHHEAHVHGKAELFIAVEGDDFEIEFHSPAMNIVGFEHMPVGEAQIQAVNSAIGALKQPDQLFSLPSVAKCEPVSIEVESPLAEHGDHDHDHDHEEDQHANFTGHYQFQCAEMSRLDRIEVKLFERFPGTEVIEVQSISKRGQQKIDLTPGQSALEL